MKTLVSNPGSLRKIVDQEQEYFKIIKKNHPAFKNGLPVVEFSEFMGTGEIIAEPYTFLGGNSLPTDLALLRHLAGRVKNCRYFEIGTWRGESVANVAGIADECFTLNLPDSTMLEMGEDKSYVNMHRFFSKNLKNVTHLQHDSMSFDFSNYKNKLDLIFIDGDHHYNQVLSDSRNAFGLLKDESSIIVWHDYGFEPEKIRFEVLAGILDACPASLRDNLYHVSETKCAVFIRQKLKTRPNQADRNPNHHYKVELTERKIT